MSAATMKRFYNSAAPEPAETGWIVALDGRPLMTPAGGKLILPSEDAAALIAEEWNAQGDPVHPHELVITRLANVAADRMGAAREETADAIQRYAETDVLCHMAEAPVSLQERQRAEWKPLLDWAREELGVALSAVCGIRIAEHDPAALKRVRELTLELDNYRLTSLAHAAGVLTSAILAFALLRGRLGAAEAMDLATLDARAQQEFWGTDAEAAKRDAGLREELAATERFVRAL